MVQPKIEWTEDIDIAWHFEGNEIVVDRCNVGEEPAPLDKETFSAVWPDWILVKGEK